MTRALSGIIVAATNQDSTSPKYLIEFSAWSATSPLTATRIATWDVNIAWNSQTWLASGAEIDRLSSNGGTLKLPNGDGDPWLNLVSSIGTRDIAVTIYEHHTSTGSPGGSDAAQVFSGIMDGHNITDKGISIELIEGKSSKGFPPSSINPTTYQWLLPKNSRIYWGPDIVNWN